MGAGGGGGIWTVIKEEKYISYTYNFACVDK